MQEIKPNTTPGVVLRVIEPFRAYAVGQEVTDPAQVAEILASEQSGHVIKVQAK